MKLHKKAITFSILNFGFWRILFISILFFFISKLAASQIQGTIDVSDLRATIFSSRALNARTGFLSISEYTFQQTPGIIQIAKFTDDIINSQFDNHTNVYAASLTLQNIDTNKQEEVLQNKKWFDRYEPLTQFPQYVQKLRWRYVLIQNESLSKGRLLMKWVQHE